MLDLVYQCVLVLLGLVVTFALTRSAESTPAEAVPLPPVKFLGIMAGSGAFASSAMFVVSAQNQWSRLASDGDVEVSTQLKLSVVLSAILAGASVCLSLALVVLHSVQTSKAEQRTPKASLQTCLLLLAPINLEMAELLSWRGGGKHPMAPMPAKLLVLPPLLCDVPLAAVIAYYIMACTSLEAMAENRATHIVTALVALTLVLASICTRLISRFCSPSMWQEQEYPAAPTHLPSQSSTSSTSSSLGGGLDAKEKKLLFAVDMSSHAEPSTDRLDGLDVKHYGAATAAASLASASNPSSPIIRPKDGPDADPSFSPKLESVASQLRWLEMEMGQPADDKMYRI